MNPATITLIIQGIEAAIAAAPGVVEVAQKAKDFISSLFTANLITKDVQDALHAHVDAVSKMAEAGVIPNHWQVQPDPA